MTVRAVRNRWCSMVRAQFEHSPLRLAVIPDTRFAAPRGQESTSFEKQPCDASSVVRHLGLDRRWECSSRGTSELRGVAGLFHLGAARHRENDCFDLGFGVQLIVVRRPLGSP
jgi:hypothetical protein